MPELTPNKAAQKPRFVDPFEVQGRPAFVDPFTVQEELTTDKGPFLTAAPEEGVLDKITEFFSFFKDPQKEQAKAVQALVDADALGISPSQAYEYRGAIDSGVELNPTALGLRSTLTDRVRQSWEIGNLQKQQNNIAYRALMSADVKADEAIDTITIPTIEETFVSKSGLEDAARSAAKMTPMMADVAMEGGAKGMALGMGFGGIALLAGQPEFAPAAVKLGLTIGGAQGGFEGALRMEAGGAYVHLRKLKDSFGNAIDRDIARASAFAIGAINAGIEVSQISTLLKTIPGLNKIVSNSIMEVVTSKTVLSKLAAIARAYSGSVASETGQEVAQQGVEIILGELAKTVNNKIKGTDIKHESVGNILERLKDEAVEAAKAFSVLSLPGHVVSGVVEGVKSKKQTDKLVRPEAPEPELVPIYDEVAKRDGAILGIRDDVVVVSDRAGKVSVVQPTVEGVSEVLTEAPTVAKPAVDIEKTEAVENAAIDEFLAKEEITEHTIDQLISDTTPEVTVTPGPTTGELVTEIKSAYLSEDSNAALVPLVEIGKNIWESGKVDFNDFVTELKSKVGDDAWKNVSLEAPAIWDMTRRLKEQQAIAIQDFAPSRSQKIMKGAKSAIRKTTGQEKISTLVREDIAFRESLRQAARAARKAFSEGVKQTKEQAAEVLKETKAQAKQTLKQTKEQARQTLKEMLAKQRESIAKRAEIRAVLNEIMSVRKKLKTYQPEARTSLEPIFASIDFTNMSEKSRVDLQPLKDLLAQRPDLDVDKELSKKLDRVGQVPIRDFTINDLEELRDLLQEYETLSREKLQERTGAIESIQKTKKSSMKDVHVDFKKRINALLGKIDFKGGMSEQNRQDLLALKEFIEREGIPLGIHPRHLAAIERAEKIPFKDFATEDLVALDNEINILAAIGRHKLGYKFKYDEARRESALKSLLASTKNIDVSVKDIKEKTRQDEIRVSIKKAYLQTLHTPRVADMIDGFGDYKGENATYIKTLGEAELAAVFRAKELKVAFMEDVTALGISDVSEESQRNMMINIRHREGALDAVKTLLGKYGLAEIPKLTLQEEGVLKLIQKYTQMHKDELVATFEEINNEIFPEIPIYYLPLKYEKEAHLISDANVKGGTRTTQTFQGFTHKRVKGVKQTPRIDIFNIFDEAVDEQQWYLKMQPVVEDIKQLVFDPRYSLKGGEMAQAWWADELDIVARRGWSNTAKDNPGLRAIRRNLADSILLYKTSTIVLQPFAMFDAMAFINSKYGPLTAAKIIPEVTKTFLVPKYAKEYIETSKVLQIRKGGELAIEESFGKTTKTLRDKMVDFGYSLISKADINTAAGVQKAVENILSDLGSSNAKRDAEFIMELVSGSTSVSYRPHILSTGEAARTWFTFSNFIMNRWGIISHDIVMSGAVKSKGSHKKLLALLSLGVLMMNGESEDKSREIINGFLNQKDYDKREEGFWNVIFNLAATAPFIGPAVSAGLGKGEMAIPATRVLRAGTQGLIDIVKGKPSAKLKGATKASEAVLEAYMGIPGTASAFDIAEGFMFEND